MLMPGRYPDLGAMMLVVMLLHNTNNRLNSIKSEPCVAYCFIASIIIVTSMSIIKNNYSSI